eukprot:1993430-Rhodomonas_salina.1
MAQILRDALAADTNLMSKGVRRTTTSRKNVSPWCFAAKMQPKEEPITSSACSEADTDEQASAASPFAFHFVQGTFVAAHHVRGVSDDDQELQAKLAKERFSAEDLLPPFHQGELEHESSDSIQVSCCASLVALESSRMKSKGVGLAVLHGDDMAEIQILCKEGLPNVFGASISHPASCMRW